MDKIVRVLDAIETDIGVRGWVNGNPVRLGKACLGQSAAANAIAQRVEHFRVCELLLTAAHIQTGKRWTYVPEYNDAPGRTLADVMGVLRIARELCMAEIGEPERRRVVIPALPGVEPGQPSVRPQPQQEPARPLERAR